MKVVVGLSLLSQIAQGGLVRDAFNVVSDFIGSREEDKFQVKHFNDGNGVYDQSVPGLPKVRIGSRVIDLTSGLMFDDLLQDSANEIRAPSAIVFYDSNDEVCMEKYNQLQWDSVAENMLPARERILTARYDMYSAPRRAWYKFTPEMDLEKRLQVTECPQLVFVSRKCDGETDWCSRGFDKEDPNIELMGCEDFVDQCTPNDYEHYKGNTKGMVDWIKKKIKDDGEPMVSPFLRSYTEQGLWMQGRDTTSIDNHMRNIYLSKAFPAFTKRGFKAMPIPEDFQKWLLSFYNRNIGKRKSEFWDAGSTQMSYDQVPTTFIDMDMERFEKERQANIHLKPLVEEWSKTEPLELTSFYGQREYPEGSMLKNHVDRIDTHVLSVTLSIKKINQTEDSKPWPLEVIDWTGQHVRYHHPEGTMVLYESAKLPHGRPYRNRGGVHLGSFCHFKPVQMHGEHAKKWDDIVRVARKHKSQNTQQARYRSTPSQEPSKPVYSPIAYGQGTKWKHLGETEKANPVDDGRFTVIFKNTAKYEVDVFWKSPEGESFIQGSIGSNASFQVNTFPGHKFFFTKHNDHKPLVNGNVEIEQGRTVYAYKI